MAIFYTSQTDGHIVNDIIINVAGFPLFITRRGSSTGPTGIQDTETLDRLLDG